MNTKINTYRVIYQVERVVTEVIDADSIESVINIIESKAKDNGLNVKRYELIERVNVDTESDVNIQRMQESNDDYVSIPMTNKVSKK